MRLKVFLSVVFAACGLLLLLAFLRPTRGARAAVPGLPAEEKPGAVAVHRLPGPGPGRVGPEVAASTRPTLAPTNQPVGNAAQDRYDQIKKRVIELGALAMEDDAASLATILSELENPEPQIREAALDATVQFGSRDAIPRLRELAARTEDLQTRHAFEQAAEFLTLPSLTEVLDERKQASRR
jgi:hypothetical protein